LRPGNFGWEFVLGRWNLVRDQGFVSSSVKSLLIESYLYSTYTGLFKMFVGVQLCKWQFRTKFGKQPPSYNSIRRWYAQFQVTGCVCIPEMKARIRTATETITADIRNELCYRVDVCRITKVAPVEHL